MRYAQWLTWGGAFMGGLIILALLTASAPVNPPIIASRTIEAQLNPPPAVASTFRRACYDCHSNATRWPWYSQVPPAAWVVSGDVHRARTRMNFSDWPDTVAKPHMAAALLFASCSALSAGMMPPPRYLLLHPEARVSKAEADQFCAWSSQQAATIGARRRRQAITSGTQSADTEAENRGPETGPQVGSKGERTPQRAPSRSR